MNVCSHCGETHQSEHQFCPVTGLPIDMGNRLVGKVFLGHYKALSILDSGKTGVVMEVEDMRSNRRLAAKIVHPRHSHDSRSVDKMLDDSALAGKLGCKHIAEVIETGRDAGASPVIVREIMKGQRLESYVEEKGRLTLQESVEIAREILIALDAIHGADLFSFNITSRKVFLVPSNGKKIAKIVDTGERHIKKGEFAEGQDNSGYRAPEQRSSGWLEDRRADLYAAGAILYEMITGRVPEPVPIPIRSLHDDIDLRLAEVIQKALDAMTARRFQTAADFIAALDGLQSGVREEPAKPEKPLLEVFQPSQVIGEEKEESDREHRSSVERIVVEEINQPSVIVDMPEMERRFPFVYLRSFRLVLFVLLGVVAIAAIGVVVFAMTREKEEPQTPQAKVVSPPVEIAIKVIVEPPNAIIALDGRRIEGSNPYTLMVMQDDNLHTIRGRAEGYEPLERDIKFDKDKTVKISLMEIIQPDDAGDENDQRAEKDRAGENRVKGAQRSDQPEKASAGQ